MAEKQYISPIRLFEHLGIEYQDDLNIPRMKKHLNAEFGIARDGFIEVDGHNYNKHDVLTELDREDFTGRMFYHRKIWQFHFLLAMLESNETNIPEVLTAMNDFQKDQEFDEFFSPYFAGPFNMAARYCINNNDLPGLSEWFRLQAFLLPEDREDAFVSTRIFLEDTLRVFNNISIENYLTFRPKLAHWLRWGWHKFINNLPPEFYHFKEEITVCLINLTVKLQKKYTDDCRDISNDLMLVKDLREDLHDTIINNDKAFNPVSTGSGGGNYWWVIWVVIILFRAVASGGCN